MLDDLFDCEVKIENGRYLARAFFEPGFTFLDAIERSGHSSRINVKDKVLSYGWEIQKSVIYALLIAKYL